MQKINYLSKQTQDILKISFLGGVLSLSSEIKASEKIEFPTPPILQKTLIKSPHIGEKKIPSIDFPPLPESLQRDKKQEIIIDIVGDITPSEDLRVKGRFENLLKEIKKQTSLSTQEVFSYPFSNVKSYFDQSYTIGNLETSALPRALRIAGEEGKYKRPKGGNTFFHFATDEELIKMVHPKNSSIEAVSIANNHSGDFGEYGFNYLKKITKENELKYFGDNKNSLQVTYDIYKGIKIAMISSTIYNSLALESEKNKLQKALSNAKDAQSNIIVVYYHWGKERNSTPETYQKNLAYFAAEHGASIVAGSHQHVLSGTQEYKTKDGRIVPIAYGLANFMFGGNGNPKDKDSMIFRNTFEYNSATKEIIWKENINIPVHATRSNNFSPTSRDIFKGYQQFRPTPAIGAESERISKKIPKYK